MKKNFLSNLSKLNKSLADSTNKFFPKQPCKKQQSWWNFNGTPQESSKITMDQLKNIFSSNKLNQKNYLNRIKQKVKDLSSKQNQAFLNAYKDKIKQSAQQSKKIYDQKAAQIKSKMQENIKDKNFNWMNEENLKLIKKKSSQATQIFSQTKQSLKERLQKSKEYIDSKSQKIPKQIGRISGKVYEQVKQKVDVKKKIEKSLNLIFWRAAILLGIVAFCYGLGTSLPRQLRSILKDMYKDEQNTVNQAQSAPSSNDKFKKSEKVQATK